MVGKCLKNGNFFSMFKFARLASKLKSNEILGGSTSKNSKLKFHDNIRDFRYVEKIRPLTRIHVEKILSKFCLSKQFSYICKNTCRKYSGSHLMFEIFLSKLFSQRAQKCEIFYNVEIIPGIRTRLLNIFDCRKNSVFLI